MIISFSGRKSSGKTMLAEEAIKRGFKKISFADKLKKITSQILACDTDDLYDPIKKEEELNKKISWIEIKPILENILGVSINLCLNNKIFKNRREVLQFLGTEVIRTLDPEFHVNSLREQVNKNENYVLDDTRFENELNLLGEYNATCVFVIRSSNLDYSNHQSETSLSRKYFNKVFNNNSTKEKAKEIFNRFLDHKTDLENNTPSRHGGKLSNFFLENNNDSAYLSAILYILGNLTNKNNCNLLMLEKKEKINKWILNAPIKKPIDLFSIYDNRLTVDNEIYIDDFKRWDILQKDKNPDHVPAILNKEIEKYWKMGIKDALSFKI